MAYSKYLNHSGIDIVVGRVLNTTGIHKFGAVPAMSQSKTGTIWDINDTLYPWSAFTIADTLDIVATNSGDVADITHDRSVTIFGLDENYNLIQETVTITGLTGQSTTKLFKRVYRACFNDGPNANIGIINININGITICRINAGKGQTLMCVFTIPAGYTGYLTQGTATVQKGGDATIDMFVRYTDSNSFRIGHTAEISGEGGQYDYIFTLPSKIPAMSDIDVRASVRTNNARVTAAFDLILVKN